MGDRMEIGYDLDLLLDAARLVINGRTWPGWTGRQLRVIDQAAVQRHVRVGFAKAGRLLLLLEDFGIITRSGRNVFACTVERGDLEAALAEIRTAHDVEKAVREQMEAGDGAT